MSVSWILILACIVASVGARDLDLVSSVISESEIIINVDDAAVGFDGDTDPTAAKASRGPRGSAPALDASLPSDSMEAEMERQYRRLAQDIRAGTPFVNEAYRPEATILTTDRDPLNVVLRRTRALLAHIIRLPGAPDLSQLAARLTELNVVADRMPVDSTADRKRLYLDACRLRRAIALANPLLDFKEILLFKRMGLGRQHMCDQYYGHDQTPGGGLYVLSDPFGKEPVLHDVLANSVVVNGRLQGRKLSGSGSFLSPTLSYDGKRIAFAYVECEGVREYQQHTDHVKGHWTDGWSYHIFSVNTDGTDLRMLTDGAFNDIYPCFMPSGRIAFISERRGGYLRCGRVCPVYTLFDMAPDGSDIRCLSYHETNEWSPSVSHDGMILWTRWDYVDRHGCVAHHPWTTTLDGRDPRAIHGSYSIKAKRADMEIDVRAIPESRRLVATAAPHHGFSFGSLVAVDPNTGDDDAMGPVRRVTPDVGFPESQARGMDAAYGQAWPLSEDFFLRVYRNNQREPYALYIVDSFGNKEFVYRDTRFHCLGPQPLRTRPSPPVVPEMCRRVPEGAPAEALVTLVDAYRSLKPWPAGTRIKALRVYQLYPLSLPSAAVFGRHETGPRIPQGSDSINLARAVLGTVPVEEDGSAHFIAPARKELYFQALDEKGLAITSMRSGTHFQPGEKATCQGCHEPKHSAPQPPRNTLLALRRDPSRISLDVDGSAPICYPRLVQPVLDRKCVKCHAENSDKAPPLDGEEAKMGHTTYTVSYKSLVTKYGFYSYPDHYRSTPGQFGARASKLYALLSKGHKNVKLSDEEMHRIVLWLDSVSLFYGVYEPEGQAAQLLGQPAKPTLE